MLVGAKVLWWQGIGDIYITEIYTPDFTQVQSENFQIFRGLYSSFSTLKKAINNPTNRGRQT
jgi:hypothetical protein